MSDILRANLLSPIVLAFVLGVITKLIRSEFSLPKDLYASLGIYLLFAIGIKGGVELAHSTFQEIARPAAVTLLLGCLTPVLAYLTLRRLGRFSTTDSAAIAAHYGSVSAVTFIAAQQFVQRMGAPAEGFMPTLLTLLESPGIHIALGIGAVQRMKQLQAAGPAADGVAPTGTLKEVLHEVLTARTMVLLVGGLLVGFLMGEDGWKQVKPFFDGGFKGALTLFILEMGIIAAARLGDLKKVGPFLLGFGMLMPVVHGTIGAALGSWAGLSVGGATVLATMAASASYIAAPPAVRVQLPEANPTLYLTAALAITFPFNVVIGIPLYFKIAQALHGA
jgi:uncharacterized protein